MSKQRAERDCATQKIWRNVIPEVYISEQRTWVVGQFLKSVPVRFLLAGAAYSFDTVLRIYDLKLCMEKWEYESNFSVISIFDG